jgi:hypothetical protein
MIPCWQILPFADFFRPSGSAQNASPTHRSLTHPLRSLSEPEAFNQVSDDVNANPVFRNNPDA